LEPVWRSQPIPAKQEGPVRIIVADSFTKEILTLPGDRDVVFYIFAPWYDLKSSKHYFLKHYYVTSKSYLRCGHCKKFDNIYKKLAKDMGSERLIFTKMDGTANDIPPAFEIKGYPTIFFLPAHRKHEPILYEGDRKTDHFRVSDFLYLPH
jgi:thioredoxin family protein